MADGRDEQQEQERHYSEGERNKLREEALEEEGELALTMRIRRSFLARWTEFSCSPSQPLNVCSLFSTNVFQQ